MKRCIVSEIFFVTFDIECYYKHQFRDTQDTLAVIESLDLDGDPPTQEEIAKKVSDLFSLFISRFHSSVWMGR